MADKNIKITVRDRRAIVEGSPVIICGNSGYTVTFAFDDEWNLTGVRTARFVYFKDGTVQHEDVVFSDNVVAVPVLSDVAFVKVGVFAGDLCTTTPARINCEASILCGSGAVHEPTPDVYNQIMALFNEMAEKGAFGATEAQAQQIETNRANIQTQAQKIETNRADIAALADGSKKAGDAEKLGGHDSSYFATAQSAAENKTSIDNLKSGTTPVGNANKVGGYDINGLVTIDGRNTIFNPVKNLNDFHNGIALFDLNTANMPYADWALIIAGGVSGTDCQVAFSLFNTHTPKLRNCASGSWCAWGELNVGLANYLPKSGGTLTSSHSNMVLNIISALTTGAYIRFSDGNNVACFLGVNREGKPAYSNGNAEYDILHTGNVGSYALPLSGGTVQELALGQIGMIGDSGFKIVQDGNILSYLTFSGRNKRFEWWDPTEGYHCYQMLDTKNSAKVSISESAPSDTSALWVW